MTLKKIVYPFDLSGSLSSNRIEEEHTLGVDAYRAFSLANGPFYAEDLVIKERNSGTTLTRGDDYELVFYYDTLSQLTAGLEICGVIVVHNTDVSEDITVTANIVGGPYAHSAQVIADAIDALEIDNRNAYWSDIIDKPDLFQPTPHLHDIGDVYGFEFITDILGNIRDTLASGESAKLEAISSRIEEIYNTLNGVDESHAEDYNNPHRVTAEHVNAYDKEAIDSYKQTVTNSFNALPAMFTELEDKITTVESAYNGYNSALQQQSYQLRSNEEALTRINQVVANVNSAISDYNTAVSQINEEITSLKERDSELSSAIGTNTKAISTERSRNNDQDGSIEEIESNINSINTELERQKNVDTTLTENIEANTQDITSHGSRLTANESNITSQGNSITDILQRLTSLGSKVQVLEAREIVSISGEEQITGLTPGQKYFVFVYGITTHRGNNTYTLQPVTVKDSSGVILATTNSKVMNWHDGSAPHSAVLPVTGPDDGIIKGYTDMGAAINMVAFTY